MTLLRSALGCLVAALTLILAACGEDTDPPPPVELDKPLRFFEFREIRLDDAAVITSGNFDQMGQTSSLPSGDLRLTERFGTLLFAPPGSDAFADGEIFSSATGKTFYVEVESPASELLDQIPERTVVGSRGELVQLQSFRKNADNAKLELVITDARVLLIDVPNPGPRSSRCPWGEATGNELARDCFDELFGTVTMNVLVTPNSGSLGAAEAGRRLRSTLRLDHRKPDFETFMDDFGPPTAPPNESYQPLFRQSDFIRTQTDGTIEVKLKQPLRVPVDISFLPVCTDANSTNPQVCPEFTLAITVKTEAKNRRGGETYAFARLRDPLDTNGVVNLETTGLTPTNRPLLPTEIDPQPAPACSAGADSQAGSLRLSAERYRVMEFGEVTRQIFVTRQGGTRGEISATVTSRDGSAVAGTHYTPISQTVVFGDGDDLPRAITLPTLDNTANGGNVSLELKLSAAPQCATIATPSSAEVTIIDDEARPQPLPSGVPGTLDTSFDSDGRSSLIGFGGDRSGMALQADDKIVMVGGSAFQFQLARFNADGTLDASFGADGKVATAFVDGALDQTARAVAVQADGKIVVVGGARQPGPPNRLAIALARYNTDGTLDASFGLEGKVFDATRAGTALAVAIQADGKIVVAGDAPLGADPSAVLVARYNADGSVDTGFGTGGLTIIDATTGPDRATHLVLQADGQIVVAGNGNSYSTSPQRASMVMRFSASGALDPSFASGGRLLFDLGALEIRGLALQADGKLLLAGNTSVFPSSFALMRLTIDGSVDTTFGDAGSVTTSISGATSGRGDAAFSIALQRDGSILLAGTAGSINENFALARYDTNGLLIMAFGSSGTSVIDFSGGIDRAEHVALQSDGRIVLGGRTTESGTEGYGLARINP